MPGWHEAVKDLYDSGKLQLVGIIQEQHADRCRLFMQWKQMDWPILVDSLNLLEVSEVPITVAIDEYGIVRETGLQLGKAEEFRAGFMRTEFSAPTSADTAKPLETWPAPIEPAGSAHPRTWRQFGDLIVRSNNLDRIDEAVAAYQQVLDTTPQDGWAEFRLGVALRKRYDSDRRRDGDFQAAVNHWQAALDIDPNQYIRRRRIQQYGPRLDKPYPFYDWVPRARLDILARGETPVKLTVEPGGAEFAEPSEEFTRAETAVVDPPDPEGRIHRDDEQFIALETTVVPRWIAPGEASRIHLNLRPRGEIKAHWNNEVDGLEVWLNETPGCRLDGTHRSLPNPPEAVSLEERRAEFEIRCDENAAAGPRSLNGYALFYVCEDVNGTCLYRRRDFESTFELR